MGYRLSKANVIRGRERLLAGDMSGDGPSPGLRLAVLLFAAVATIGTTWGGPVLGDHEAIVAQCARDMRMTGDWLIPQFLDTPFIRKPPLPYWLVAIASYVFPNDHNGLPVTAAAARFPSALAGFGTVLLCWFLGGRMFGAWTGLLAGVLSASCLMVLLYSPNATVEMQLTFFCVWAFAQFWLALRARTAGWRFTHMMLFYVALGLGMLAKGPAPMAMVAVPLAVWWYLERPLRILARGIPPKAGEGSSNEKRNGRNGGLGFAPLGRVEPVRSHARTARMAGASLLRGLLPRTKQAFTRLYLFPGIVVFLLMFVPWMLAVSSRHEHAWNLWNWQYWQRLQGKYDESKDRGPLYYVPYVFGMVLPWVFLFVEAVVSPWIRRYAHWRRALLFCGMWAVIGITVMSAEKFKKPYYITPAIPGLVLLLAVAARRFYARALDMQNLGLLLLAFLPDRRFMNRGLDGRRTTWTLWGGMAAGLLAALVGGGFYLRSEFPELLVRGLAIGAGVAILLLAATALHIRGRSGAGLAVLAITTVAAFHTVWYTSGPLLGDIGEVEALARLLDEKKVPYDARVLWVDQRPDARLSFYFDRRSGHLTKPEEIVNRLLDRTSEGAGEIMQEMVMENAEELLAEPTPGYLIARQRSYDLAHRYGGLEGHVIGRVPRDPEQPERDWLLVANAAGLALAPPTTTAPASH